MTQYQTSPLIETATAIEHIKALVFGPAGHGKTRLLGTANQDERTGPILILEYEGGADSLVDMSPAVDIVKIRDWNTFNEIYTFLSQSKHKYRSVGLDSLSEAHTMALYARLDGTDRKNRKVDDQLDENDYGIALTQMRRLIRKFRDLPYHFFATALSQEISDPKDGRVIAPLVHGKFVNEVIGIFTFCFYLAQAEIKEEERIRRIPVLLTDGRPKYRTKLRLPEGWSQPDAQIVDPTIGMIYDQLHK